MKQRAKNDINIPLIGKLLKGSVIDNTSKSPDKIIFADKAGFVTAIPSKDYAANFENVDANTPVNVMLQKNAVVENVEGGIGNFAKGIQMGSAIGTLAGLGFGYYRKSGVGGYIGYAIGFGILGAIVGGYISGKSAIKSLKDTVGGTATSGTATSGTTTGATSGTKTDTKTSGNDLEQQYLKSITEFENLAKQNPKTFSGNSLGKDGLNKDKQLAKFKSLNENEKKFAVEYIKSFLDVAKQSTKPNISAEEIFGIMAKFEQATLNTAKKYGISEERVKVIVS